MAEYHVVKKDDDGDEPDVKVEIEHANSSSLNGKRTEDNDSFILIGKDLDDDVDQNDTNFFFSGKDAHGQHKPKTKCALVRFRIGMVVEHVYFRIFTILLILVDISLVVVDLATPDTVHYHKGLEIASRGILTYFVFEILLRMFYKGNKFFMDWADMLDMLVVFATFVIDLAFSDYGRLGVAGRSLRIVRIARGIYLMSSEYRHFQTATRQRATTSKQKFRKGGYELDLCYITDRLLALSFPLSGVQSLYKNPIATVANFLDTKHTGHYRVYDLCSELKYDRSIFHKQVRKVKIDDHNVIRLQDMMTFCLDVREWLTADDENIIAIHCKAGKDRTGTTLCTWLIQTELFNDVQESIDYFGKRRTDENLGSLFQGVDTPSQCRYIEYFEKVKWELGWTLPPVRYLKLNTVNITSIRGVGKGNGSDLSMEIIVPATNTIFKCSLHHNTNCTYTHNKDDDTVTITLDDACPILESDIKVRFLSSSKHIPRVYDNCAFFFWFHTSFITENRLCLPREYIDNPNKRRSHRTYRDTFSVELIFEEVNVKDDTTVQS